MTAVAGALVLMMLPVVRAGAAPAPASVPAPVVSIHASQWCLPGTVYTYDPYGGQAVESQLSITGLTPGQPYWLLTGGHDYQGEDGIYSDGGGVASATGTLSFTAHSLPVYPLTHIWWSLQAGVWTFPMMTTQVGASVASGTTPISLTPCGTLKVGAGYRSQIASPNGLSVLAMQTDGNLVLRQRGKAVWSTSTMTHPGNYAKVQADGNFVVYSAQNKALWNSRTNSGAIAKSDISGIASGTKNTLILYNNGNLILRTTQGVPLYSSLYGRALWQTATGNVH